VSTFNFNGFDEWIAAEYAGRGPFTGLVILVDIDGQRVTPLCSTYLSVVGDDVDWSEIIILFAGSGVDWNGACFFPVTNADGGPLDNPTARLRLRELETRVDSDRLVLNEGHFFDKQGRRIMVEEITLQ
jgi:hypothetical protein